ncbi:MAG: nitronate monooxygenase [Vulcanimicrobiota bacterium]
MLERLGLRLPVLQAPMAGVSTPAMAAAVCEAGGLGGVAIGHLNLELAREVIQETRRRTPLPFNVNLFCHAPPAADAAREQAWLDTLRPHFQRYGAEPPARLHPAYPVPDRTVLALLLELKPAVVSFHFGIPNDFVIPLRAAGVMVLGCATNLKEGRALQQAGVDAIVAQGYEAGGHRGCFDPDLYDENLSTMALLQQLRSLGLPLVAAGGVMDGVGARALRGLGALACQCGTAYVACPESAADPVHVRRLLQADLPTVMTRAISGRPARGLVNHFNDITGEPPAYPTAYSAAKALHAAAKAQGEFGYGAHWAGQGACLARSAPAAEMTRLLA